MNRALSLWGKAPPESSGFSGRFQTLNAGLPGLLAVVVRETAPVRARETFVFMLTFKAAATAPSFAEGAGFR